MSCQESTRRFLLRFLLGRAATLVSTLDLVSKLIVESIGQSTFLSFFEDDVCSVFSASGKFLPESRHKCGNVTHVRFATSIFFDGQKNVSSLQLSRVSPPSHSRIVTSQSLGPGFV